MNKEGTGSEYDSMSGIEAEKEQDSCKATTLPPSTLMTDWIACT